MQTLLPFLLSISSFVKESILFSSNNIIQYGILLNWRFFVTWSAVIAWGWLWTGALAGAFLATVSWSVPSTGILTAPLGTAAALGVSITAGWELAGRSWTVVVWAGTGWSLAGRLRIGSGPSWAVQTGAQSIRAATSHSTIDPSEWLMQSRF